jgi:hypothetical protein
MVPLIIHVDPHNPVVIHKSCRYCPPCDLLIAHQDEVKKELAALGARCSLELVNNRTPEGGGLYLTPIARRDTIG